MVYLVSYDLRPGLFRNMEPFYEELKRSPDWWHYLDRTWLIATHEPIGEVWDRLRQHLGRDDSILIIKVTPEYQGWLPADAWEWIRKKETEAQFYY